MNEGRKAADKELSNTQKHHNPNENSLAELDFLVAAVFTLPAIMSTAIPESTHLPIKSRLLLLLSALIPLFEP